MNATSRHLCAVPTCRETTKHVLCWTHYRELPKHLYRGGDEAIRAWAKNRQPQPSTPPVRPFNEPKGDHEHD